MSGYQNMFKQSNTFGGPLLSPYFYPLCVTMEQTAAKMKRWEPNQETGALCLRSSNSDNYTMGGRGKVIASHLTWKPVQFRDRLKSQRGLSVPSGHTSEYLIIHPYATISLGFLKKVLNSRIYINNFIYLREPTFIV